MTAARPPFALRLAVVVGAASLLLGLVGVVLILVADDDTASAAGRGLEAHVRVAGIDAGRAVVVAVRWQDGAILYRESAQAVASKPGLFLLPQLPASFAVTIEVLDPDTAPPSPLASKEVVVRPGDEIVIDLAAPAPH